MQTRLGVCHGCFSAQFLNLNHELKDAIEITVARLSDSFQFFKRHLSSALVDTAAYVCPHR
jgi:hypothetical protein